MRKIDGCISMEEFLRLRNSDIPENPTPPTPRPDEGLVMTASNDDKHDNLGSLINTSKYLPLIAIGATLYNEPEHDRRSFLKYFTFLSVIGFGTLFPNTVTNKSSDIEVVKPEDIGLKIEYLSTSKYKKHNKDKINENGKQFFDVMIFNNSGVPYYIENFESKSNLESFALNYLGVKNLWLSNIIPAVGELHQLDRSFQVFKETKSPITVTDTYFLRNRDGKRYKMCSENLYKIK